MPKQDVPKKDITVRSVNAIRALAIDAIQKAGSGHPGLPLGAAPVGYTLFARTMRHNPKNPMLRAIGRSRLDASVRAAAFVRLPAHDR